MQDNYVGDIGDYGKLGLLRAITGSDSDLSLSIKRAITGSRLTLSINWYKTYPESNKLKKHDDGIYTHYLKYREKYEAYDEDLYRKLKDLVDEKSRNIKSLEEPKREIVEAKFYDDPVPQSKDRELWHNNALKKIGNTDIVFLDPDNGIETQGMVSKKHVKWSEIKDYYKQGQSVIIYQHQPRIKKDIFIKNILQQLQSESINADSIRILGYSSYVSRFFILLLHKKHCKAVDAALSSIKERISNKKELSEKFCTIEFDSRRDS